MQGNRALFRPYLPTYLPTDLQSYLRAGRDQEVVHAKALCVQSQQRNQERSRSIKLSIRCRQVDDNNAAYLKVDILPALKGGDSHYRKAMPGLD